MKTALITGVAGQDGAYLARFLLCKRYKVHGIKRRSSLYNTQRIDAICQGLHGLDKRFFLHYMDPTDSSNIISIIQKVRPDEVYNLGAQSHVKVSFESAEYTAGADVLGVLRILEAVRLLGLAETIRIYQASNTIIRIDPRYFPRQKLKRCSAMPQRHTQSWDGLLRHHSASW